MYRDTRDCKDYYPGAVLYDTEEDVKEGLEGSDWYVTIFKLEREE